MHTLVTGMGLVTPVGSGVSPLWESCLSQSSFIKDGLGVITPDLQKNFWEEIAGSKWIKNPPEYLSKSAVFALHSIIHAIDHAEWKNFTDKDLIIIGTTTGQICLWENEMMGLLKIDTTFQNDILKLSKQPLQSLADCLTSVLNFPGKILILASACSASTQAIIAAEQYLASGRAERCIAGGVEELSDLTITGFSCLKLLSQHACKPFDQTRVGINLSEGAAFYTFENKSDVTPLAYLYSGDTVLDSFHMTSPSAEGAGLQKAIRSSLKKNHLDPSAINMLHAHGTGSIHNDQSEAFAINEIFSHRPPVISTKGVHGHALGASGAIELGICLRIINDQLIPPITGLEMVDGQIKLQLPKVVVKTKIDFLMKTTLGFGGVNSTFILGRSPHA